MNLGVLLLALVVLGGMAWLLYFLFKRFSLVDIVASSFILVSLFGVWLFWLWARGEADG